MCQLIFYFLNRFEIADIEKSLIILVYDYVYSAAELAALDGRKYASATSCPSLKAGAGCP